MFFLYSKRNGLIFYNILLKIECKFFLDNYFDYYSHIRKTQHTCIKLQFVYIHEQYSFDLYIKILVKTYVDNINP